MNIGAVSFKGMLKIDSDTYINTNKIESIYTNRHNSNDFKTVNVVTDNTSYQCPDDVTIDKFMKAYNIAAKQSIS